jgi:predicted nucleic acid-binding protein
LFLKKHNNHTRAIEIWKDVKREDKIASKFLVAEVSNVLNTRLKVNIELVNKVYNFMFDELIVVDDYNYHDEALEYMNLYYPKDRLPFNDCIYMALMEDLEIKEIVSFDEHFDLNKNIKRIY